VTCGRAALGILLRTIVKFRDVPSRGRPVHIIATETSPFFAKSSSVCNAALQWCPQTQTEIIKPRQLFIAVVKRTTAALATTAMFVGPTGVTLANPPNHERQKSEQAVQRLRHQSQGNLLPMG
jgi:hypothetical protein